MKMLKMTMMTTVMMKDDDDDHNVDRGVTVAVTLFNENTMQGNTRTRDILCQTLTMHGTRERVTMHGNTRRETRDTQTRRKNTRSTMKNYNTQNVTILLV